MDRHQPRVGERLHDELLGSFNPGDPLNGMGKAIAISRTASGSRARPRLRPQPDIGGYVWSEQTGSIPIRMPRANWGVYPLAISDDGGPSSASTGPLGGSTVKPSSGRGSRHEETAKWLKQLGADLSAVGGQLLYAMDMTADGKTIVGFNGNMRLAWIAQLPSTQPTTASAAQAQPVSEPTEPAVPTAVEGR